MLLVKTKVLPSSIHGLGLFADQYIPKGTEIWRFTPGFDQKFTREQILAFEVITVTQKDIRNGEELTDNYNSFEYEKTNGDVLDEIAKKYNLVDELDPRFKQ